MKKFILLFLFIIPLAGYTQDLNGELVLTPENFMLKECCYRKFDRIGGEMFSMSELRVNNKPCYVRIHEDSFIMASGGSVSFLSLYRKQNNIILLERFRHYFNGEIPVTTEEYFFSPIIELSTK